MSCLVGYRCISITVIRFAGVLIYILISLGSSIILVMWFSLQAYQYKYLPDLGSSTVQASGGDSKLNIKLGLLASQ